MKPYCGRTGFSKWYYINEEWLLPLIFLLVPTIMVVGLMWFVIHYYG